MSYNILNKNVNFQGPTQGQIEDIVDTHTNQVVSGSKDFNALTGSNTYVRNTLSVSTHAVDHAISVAGAVSASLNISASAFYANGEEVTGGSVSAVANGANNRIATFSSADALNGEANLEFNGSVLDFKATSISGSGNISGSQFYGTWAGANINGSQVQLASGGGITDSSGLKLNSGVSAVGSLNTADKILIFDADDGDAVKRTTAGTIANLFSAAVTSYSGDTDNRIITSGGSKALVGEANLTFDGTDLLLTGNVSGSGNLQLGGTVRADGIAAAAPAYANDHIIIVDAGDSLLKKSTFSNFSTQIAGNGLINDGGKLEVQVSGAVKITSDKIGITGSVAGDGLSFGGGADSINELSVELQSNSGLTVAATGLKTNMNGLASATPAPASDSLAFIDSDGDKKCSFDTFLTAIAGANIGVSGSQLTASAGGGSGAVSSVANGADNRIATFSSSDALNGEETLTFDLYRLSIVQDQNNISGSFLRLNNTHAGNDGTDADICGTIEFYGQDDGTPTATEYARIRGEIEDASSGAEGGRLTLSVASHNGSLADGLVLVDGDASGEVDVTVGAGANSVTTVAGQLNVPLYITHEGDEDTRLKFQDDQLYIEVGGVAFMKMLEDGSQDMTVFNEAGNDIDFRIEAPGKDHMFYIDAGNDRVYINRQGASPLTSTDVNIVGDLSFAKNSNDNIGCEIIFEKSRHGTAGGHTAVQHGDVLGAIKAKGSDGTNSEFACAIEMIAGSGSAGSNDMPGSIVFSTTADGANTTTEAMKITQGQGILVPNGSLAIFGTNSGLEVSDSGTNNYSGLQVSYGHRGVTGRGGIIIRGQNSSTVGTFGITIEESDAGGTADVMIIATNENVTFTGTVSDGSDARIKTNIRSMPDNILAKVMQLRPVNYNRINQPNDDEQSSAEYTGFVAQEVEEVFPDMVHTTELAAGVSDVIPDFKSLAQKELIAVLTKAIQEQQEIIDDLKERVAVLEG